VGRGTRVHEETKKYFFTLIDFRKATNHFADPDFDGEPVQIYEPGDNDPITPPPDDDENQTDDNDESTSEDTDEEETVLVDPDNPDVTFPTRETKRRKYYIDGHEVKIVAERIEYLDESGKLVTETLRDYSRNTLRKHYASLDVFLKKWNAAERKQALIEELEAEGLLLGPLAAEVGKDLDPFDLICHVAFDQPPLTRSERVKKVLKEDIFSKYGEQARAVLQTLLQKYEDEGFINLDDPQVLKVSPFSAMGTPMELVQSFGGREGYTKAVHELQETLYGSVA